MTLETAQKAAALDGYSILREPGRSGYDVFRGLDPSYAIWLGWRPNLKKALWLIVEDTGNA